MGLIKDAFTVLHPWLFRSAPLPLPSLRSFSLAPALERDTFVFYTWPALVPPPPSLPARISWARSRAFACALRARRPFDAAGSSSFSTLSTSQLKCVSKGIRRNEKLSHANNLPQIFLTISRGYWIENSLRGREYFEERNLPKILSIIKSWERKRLICVARPGLLYIKLSRYTFANYAKRYTS